MLEYDIYIEYFGIDRNGEAPKWFKGDGNQSGTEVYKESMSWKRKLHKDNKTNVIELFAYEHFENRIPCCFLSSTVHEMYTNNPDAYIPPTQTFGKWWELLNKYKYGITYDIAAKLTRYIDKYRNEIPCTINIMQNEQILNFAYYNEYCLTGPPIKQNLLEQNENMVNI
mgnify:CR=1 FL=1